MLLTSPDFRRLADQNVLSGLAAIGVPRASVWRTSRRFGGPNLPRHALAGDRSRSAILPRSIAKAGSRRTSTSMGSERRSIDRLALKSPWSHAWASLPAMRSAWEKWSREGRYANERLQITKLSCRRAKSEPLARLGTASGSRPKNATGQRNCTVPREQSQRMSKLCA